MGVDLDNDFKGEACDVTQNMREEGEIFSLDLFTEDYETYYLICHDIEGYKKHRQLIDDYSGKNNYVLCVFDNYRDGNFKELR